MWEGEGRGRLQVNSEHVSLESFAEAGKRLSPSVPSGTEQVWEETGRSVDKEGAQSGRLTQEHEDHVDLQGVGEAQGLAQGSGERQAVQTGLIEHGHGLDHCHRWRDAQTR